MVDISGTYKNISVFFQVHMWSVLILKRKLTWNLKKNVFPFNSSKLCHLEGLFIRMRKYDSMAWVFLSSDPSSCCGSLVYHAYSVIQK